MFTMFEDIHFILLLVKLNSGPMWWGFQGKLPKAKKCLNIVKDVNVKIRNWRLDTKLNINQINKIVERANNLDVCFALLWRNSI